MGAELMIPQMMSRNEEIIRLIKENKKKKLMVGEKKEIVYNNIDRFAVIVAAGEYRGVKYVCINRGKHPCAYVMCTQEFLDKHVGEYDIIDGLHVHGGITFTGMANELLGLEDYDSPCFGWDYGHAGDWAGYISDEENEIFGHRKYTTEMLINDCESAIDQYLDIIKRDGESEKTDSNPVLTKEILKSLGFKSTFGDVSDNEDAFHLTGDEDGKRWKIFIDLHSPSKSYVLTQNPRQKYEGTIVTLHELKAVIDLFNLPVEIK